MVTYLSTLTDAASAGLVDRHRPASSLSPTLASRLSELKPRTIAPVLAAVMGEVCPGAGSRTVVECDKSHVARQQGTTTVLGRCFASISDDTQTRVEPPPLRRPPA